MHLRATRLNRTQLGPVARSFWFVINSSENITSHSVSAVCDHKLSLESVQRAGESNSCPAFHTASIAYKCRWPFLLEPEFSVEQNSAVMSEKFFYDNSKSELCHIAMILCIFDWRGADILHCVIVFYSCLISILICGASTTASCINSAFYAMLCLHTWNIHRLWFMSAIYHCLPMYDDTNS